LVIEEAQMRLNEILDGLREDTAAQPAVYGATEAMFAELRRSGAVRHALSVGDPLPDFMLPDPTGSFVERDEILAEGPLVLTFFRGHWCSACSATVDAMLEALPAMREAGATLLAVTPETGGYAMRDQARTPPGLRILSDVDNGLALACGVAFRVPAHYRGMLAAHGVNLEERQGSTSWFLPIPATFVVDRTGIVRWSFVDVDFMRRADPAAVVEALRALPG
jgi:peroxiredoxin